MESRRTTNNLDINEVLVWRFADRFQRKHIYSKTNLTTMNYETLLQEAVDILRQQKCS